MKVYGLPMSTNVARVLVCLEEAGEQYEVVPIDFSTAEHKSPEHTSRNVSYSYNLFSPFFSINFHGQNNFHLSELLDQSTMLIFHDSVLSFSPSYSHLVKSQLFRMVI